MSAPPDAPRWRVRGARAGWGLIALILLIALWGAFLDLYGFPGLADAGERYRSAVLTVLSYLLLVRASGEWWWSDG